jgi:hypothetical protein
MSGNKATWHDLWWFNGKHVVVKATLGAACGVGVALLTLLIR